MDLLVLYQGHLLVKDLTDKWAGMVDDGSVEQRNPCTLALTTAPPRHSAPKQAVLGDPRTPQMGWGK